MPNIMSQAAKRVVLASRPQGEPKATDFRIEDCPVPTPGAGEVLLRTIWLSLDPYMRGRMSDGPSYAAPVPIGGVMEGGTISEVVASNNPALAKGDIVLSRAGWQTHDKILIVDFGSQVTQLIARRVREEGVYSEIVPFQKAEAAFKEMKPKAVILSGGQIGRAHV